MHTLLSGNRLRALIDRWNEMALAPKPQASPLSNAGEIIAYYRRVGEYVGFALAHLQKLQPAEEALSKPILTNVRNSLEYIEAQVDELCELLERLEHTTIISDEDRETIFEKVVKVNGEGKHALLDYQTLMDNRALYGDISIQINALACIMLCFASHGDITHTIIAYFAASVPSRRKFNLAVVIDKTNAFGAAEDQTIMRALPSPVREKKEEGILTDDLEIPVHPGKILDQYLRDNKISVIEAAKRLGGTRENLYRLMAGSINLSVPMAKALARNQIGGSALDWLILQAKFDLAQPDRPPAHKRRAERSPAR